MNEKDIRAIWRNLDLSRPDEWETYDIHDHGADVGFTYNCHGVTVVVTGYVSREPWHGPEHIYSAELTDASGNVYDLAPIIVTEP